MPNLIALAIPFFFVGIGAEIWVAKRKQRQVYRLTTAMTDMACGIAQQLVGVLVGALSLAAYAWVYSHRLIDMPQKTWVSWTAAVLGVELAYYWWHRLSHEVNLLWAAHSVHHHSEDYNLAVALRQSVTTWLPMLLFYLPLAVLGVPTLEYAVVLGLSTLYQFWIHTELVPPLGFIEKWLNTPSLHRVHHATNARYLDKNHAATFSFLDRMFGTWEPETERCVYGVTKPLDSYNSLYAQVAGYVDIARMWKLAPTFCEKLKVVFWPPGWQPPWLPVAALVTLPRTKFEPDTDVRAKWHALGQFTLLIIGVFCFLMWGGALTKAEQAVCFVLFAMTLFSTSALIESKRWAWKVEGARLVVTVPTVALLLLGFLH